MDLDPKIVRAMRSFYDHVQRCFSIASMPGAFFWVAMGLFQGCRCTDDAANLDADSGAAGAGKNRKKPAGKGPDKR